ncbi:MAG: HAD family hydrolase [Actinobacteria bacterium]|nr:HAD family hydrolase [Actinomycetota bacterium]
MTQIEAVVFDWGGTLSAFADIDMVDMWRLAARRLDPAREDEVCRRLIEVEEASFGRARTDQRSSTLSQILQQASEGLGLDVAEAVLEEAATSHLDSWTPHIVHEADAAAVLSAIRSRGIRTGLLSNTHWPRPFHEHFLERDGLAALLDVRLYTSELSHMKPHPSVFRHALDQLHVADPQRAVFVGDRPFDDIHGASSCGLRTVLRRNRAVPGFDVDADAEIDELSDLLPVLTTWLGQG